MPEVIRAFASAAPDEMKKYVDTRIDESLPAAVQAFSEQLPKIANVLSANEGFITINEFAERLGVSPRKAQELAQSKTLCDRGIAIDSNAPVGKKGGIRINWSLYKAYTRECPAVPVYKRVPSSKKKAGKK